jgi:hypothetical protein
VARPAALAAGQWWRLVTALFVQYDPWWQIVIVFALIAGIGAIAERLFGPGRWLLLYVGCGVVGQAFGFRWQPYDAGASVAGAGLLGWGQANPPAGLRDWLAVAGIAATRQQRSGGWCPRSRSSQAGRSGSSTAITVPSPERLVT